MTREQRLFSAARHYREVNPVDPVNWFQPGTAQHNAHLARLEADQELAAALAAYEAQGMKTQGMGLEWEGKP